MNDIIDFNNEEFGNVRVVMKGGEPWFVAVDVCKALDIVNHKDALTRLDEDEKRKLALIDPHGREQVTNVVNEPGLYTLVLGSRKPQAKGFKRWIAHEVIPTIRKTGSYSVPSPSEILYKLKNDNISGCNTDFKSIYVIKDNNNYKIGVSYNPIKRHKSIKTSNPLCKLVYCSVPIFNAYALEAMLHNQLAEEGLHVGGEWFSIADANELFTRINKLIVKKGELSRCL